MLEFVGAYLSLLWLQYVDQLGALFEQAEKRSHGARWRSASSPLGYSVRRDASTASKLRLCDA